MACANLVVRGDSGRSQAPANLRQVFTRLAVGPMLDLEYASGPGTLSTCSPLRKVPLIRSHTQLHPLVFHLRNFAKSHEASSKYTGNHAWAPLISVTPEKQPRGQLAVTLDTLKGIARKRLRVGACIPILL